MGFRPIPTSKWKKWLKSKGLYHKRTKGSHEIWDMEDDSLMRPVVFRGSKPEIPGTHINSCLETLGINYNTFISEIANL